MKKEDKIKAESFDVMQYFYRIVHDPLIHGFIGFSGHIDEKILKKAVTLSIDAIPLIGCCFDNTLYYPCWKKQKFNGDDIVQVIETETNEIDKSINLLASTINIMNEPQLKIFLIKGRDNSDKMCAIINHMVCDGSGFKEYLYLLAKLYTKLENDINYKPQLCSYSRSTKLLFKNINFLEKFGILFSKYDLSKQKQKVMLPMVGDENNPFFVRRSITKEDFHTIKTFSKCKGVTINDIILTAYVRLLTRITKTDRVVIPCPADLRKYLSKGQKHGICNLTSNYFCDVIVREKDLFNDTLLKVSQQMKLQKESKKCLKSIVMLELVFKMLPFRILKRNFGKIFTIPVLSYTNLGIIDNQLLKFGNVGINDIFLTGAIKYTPYFQLAVSSFNDTCTLSSNLHGTLHDKLLIEKYLEEMINEILSNCLIK